MNQLLSAQDEPLPLGEIVVPPFPINTLPLWLQKFVTEEAEATQTPPDLSGLLVLGALSTASARKFRIQICDGYEEPVNLYLVVVLGPGNRKSAVFSHVMKPIQEIESEEAIKYAPKLLKQKALRDIKEKELEMAKKAAADCDDETEKKELIEQALRLAEQLSSLHVKSSPRYIVDDCTPERLSGLLDEQDGRMAFLSAEGGVFDIIGGRYSGNIPNLDVYLKSHSGDELRVDRNSQRDNPRFIESPAITFALAIQPDVLDGLMSKPSLKGRGLLGRFLYSLPVSLLGARDIAPEIIKFATIETYSKNLKKLMQLPWKRSKNGKISPYILVPSIEARAEIDSFAKWLEPQLGSFGELSYMVDWAGKLVGAVMRLSALLHIAEHVDSSNPCEFPISLRTVENGIKLGRYFIEHAKAGYHQMDAEPNVKGSMKILSWLRKNGLEEFSSREAWQSLKTYFRKMDFLNASLKILEEHQYIIAVSQIRNGEVGRKPGAAYKVNPQWCSQNPQYPHNHKTSRDFGYFGDIGDFGMEESQNG